MSRREIESLDSRILRCTERRKLTTGWRIARFWVGYYGTRRNTSLSGFRGEFPISAGYPV